MLPQITDPNVLVGTETRDDAAVYRLTDGLALVLTVDFFTPIVDDPYAFGQIAAANSLSDVYAMGGRPIAMLSIVGFPRDKLPMTVLAEILRGGAEKAREAGVSVVGGHSIDDAEPKAGYAVVGLVHPGSRLAERRGPARATRSCSRSRSARASSRRRSSRRRRRSGRWRRPSGRMSDAQPDRGRGRGGRCRSTR